MTDTTEIPIVVHADPKQVQIEAGLRQAGLVVGTLAAAMGASKVAAGASIAVQLAPAIGSLAGFGLAGLSFVWGQLATRKHAKQAATMADALPDRVARTKL